MTRTLNGAVRLAGELAQCGIGTMFGVMGDGNVDLIAAGIEREGIRFVAARHEQGAVSMAEGFAHSTGGVGVATVTYGPGVGNCVTALTSAARHSARVLLIAGHRTSRHGPPQFHDPNEMLDGTGAAVIRVDDAAELPGCVQRAIEQVLVGRQPAVLSVADRLLEGACDDNGSTGAAPDHSWGSRPGASTPDARLDEIAHRLLSAERPVILAGRGSVGDGVYDALSGIADQTGAALMTSLLAHGLFRDHPASLGISGGLASAAGRRAMARADLVLALGVGMSGWTMDGGRAFADAELVQIDRDETAFARSFRVPSARIVGDAGDAARRLADRLGRIGAGSANRAWWDEGATAEAEAALETGAGLEPRAFCRRLDAALPKERALALDGGHFFEAMCREIGVADERAFLWTLGFGSIGLGLATAIGAAVGRPERLTVAGLGDGGLMMSLGELETVGRYRLPILVVVMNDASYGAEEKLLEHKGWRVEHARFPATDFAAVARALGIEAQVVRSAADVKTLMPRLGALREPFLVDARIDQSQPAEFIELLHRLKAAPA